MERIADDIWLLPQMHLLQMQNSLNLFQRITFGTNYDYLVDRKIVLEKISLLESMADRRAKAVDGHTEVLNTIGNGMPIEYTRTLDKAYRSFQDDHVQKIRYHP